MDFKTRINTVILIIEFTIRKHPNIKRKLKNKKYLKGIFLNVLSSSLIEMKYFSLIKIHFKGSLPINKLKL